MKKLSVSKWLLLAGALTFAYACNCQKKESAESPGREAPSQDDEEEEREDGDMCSIPSETQREEQLSSPVDAAQEAKPVVEKTTALQEKKAELSVSAPSEVLENRSTAVEAPAPEKAKAAVTTDSAVL